jgi:hypothetical protein
MPRREHLWKVHEVLALAVASSPITQADGARGVEGGTTAVLKRHRQQQAAHEQRLREIELALTAIEEAEAIARQPAAQRRATASSHQRAPAIRRRPRRTQAHSRSKPKGELRRRCGWTGMLAREKSRRSYRLTQAVAITPHVASTRDRAASVSQSMPEPSPSRQHSPRPVATID